MEWVLKLKIENLAVLISIKSHPNTVSSATLQAYSLFSLCTNDLVLSHNKFYVRLDCVKQKYIMWIIFFNYF
jgi:hypothetical protein